MVLDKPKFVFADVKSAFGCPHLQIWHIKKKLNQFKKKEEKEKYIKEKKTKVHSYFVVDGRTKICLCPRTFVGAVWPRRQNLM